MANIIRGTSNKPVASQRLADFMAVHTEYDGLLLIGYPIIGTAGGPYPIDALWISRKAGLVIINLIEGRDLDHYGELQDDSANKLESKLRAHKQLMQGRELRIPASVLTYAPAREDVASHEIKNYPLCNTGSLKEHLDQFVCKDPSAYEELLSVLQAISTIRSNRKKRDVQKQDSRGARLKRLEDSIANLDNRQGQAVIEAVDGVQRIRGLAGSGKTIVLALKAAYLHAQHQDWKIAVTFNTRSLKGQFRQLITTFTIEQTGEEPDWDNIHIIHAWGAPGGGERTGVYYRFCELHNIEYYDFQSARAAFGHGMEFDGACQKALQEAQAPLQEIYDAILVDEAQDLPPSFLRICYGLLKADKRLVYAYDELQSLNSQSLPSPEMIFGNDPDGSPRVRFSAPEAGKPQQDIILQKCYRNSRPVLVTAHALGFGIYRAPDPDTGLGLVQIFDRSQLWLDVGYSIEEGNLADGHDVTLIRPEENSPRFLENHSTPEELIQFINFHSKREQAEWVARAIMADIGEEELRPDDIMVINPNPLTTRNEVGIIRTILFENGINSHLAGIDTTPDVFFEYDNPSVAFTGIHRAKGNEAGMIYIINAQDCYSSPDNLSGVRNQLFTAITRSKAWVRVLGIGSRMEDLIREFDKVKEHNFSLSFRYPTEEQRRHINILNRDMTNEERKIVQRRRDDISTLLDDLEKGRIYLEDLGSDQIERLRALLDKGS